MELEGVKVGLGITGSFCTFDNIMPQVQKMVDQGAEIIPIMSANASNTDTRFGMAEVFKSRIKEITRKDIVETIVDAEPLGPKNAIDVMVIAPCTGNKI